MADIVETIDPFSEAWDAALRFVKKTGWISDRVQPPAENEIVIVLSNGYGASPTVCLGRWHAGMWHLSDGSRATRAHWMPCPDPPDRSLG